jgi:hypothetical protein
MAMHISASVIVSMGELMTGNARAILRLTWLDKSTCIIAAHEYKIGPLWCWVVTPGQVEGSEPPKLMILTQHVPRRSKVVHPLAGTYLMSPKIDMTWMENDVIVRVAHAMVEQLSSLPACKKG